MVHNPLPRLDQAHDLIDALLPHCRLREGEVWVDPVSGHRVGCLDAADPHAVARLMGDGLATLAVHDPPYNLVAFDTQEVGEFIKWCRAWIDNGQRHMADDSALYVWLGADQRDHFQPLPEFMMMMRETDYTSKSFLTLRNQRGYGTQKNWMAVRQELLYYAKGSPFFQPQYTEIPKILRGYYKNVNGQKTDNLERGKSDNIRASNVWVDIQQTFYRMEENVSGCYAQKPLATSDRLVQASSKPQDIVIDFFAHSGTTLLSCERLDRICYTMDIHPVFCEITIRRLENWRKNQKLGWQNGNAFSAELTPQDTMNLKLETS